MSASANYDNMQVTAQYNSALLSPADIKRKIAGYGFAVVAETSERSAFDIEATRLRNLFFVGVAFAIPTVIFSYPQVFGFVRLAGTNVAAYIAFTGATTVQFATGGRFYTGAFRIARLGSANMDTLVVLGTMAAYVFSAYDTFPAPARHHIYYDASSLVITFILLGKYLELKTKGRKSAIIRKMLELQPKAVRVKKAIGTEVEAPVQLVQVGDIIIVRSGDRIGNRLTRQSCRTNPCRCSRKQATRR